MFLYDKSEVHRNYGIVVAEESEALYVIYWVTRWHPLQTHNFTMRMLQDRGVQSRMSHMQIDWTDQIVSSRSPSALFTRINRQLWQYKPNGLSAQWAYANWPPPAIILDCVASAGLPSTLAMKIDVRRGCKYIIFSRPRLSPQIIECMMDFPSSAVMYRDGVHNRWSSRLSFR